MTYGDVWREQIQWLQGGLDYMALQLESADETEKARLRAKMEGVRIALDRMIVTEKIYNMHHSTNT